VLRNDFSDSSGWSGFEFVIFIYQMKFEKQLVNLKREYRQTSENQYVYDQIRLMYCVVYVFVMTQLEKNVYIIITTERKQIKCE